jgi:SdpC family antimicrobial peptide
VLFVGCKNKSALERNKISGLDIYKAVFFSYGEFASKIESYKKYVDVINKLPADQKTSALNDINKLVENIGKQNPNFFAEFKTQMLSKDHNKIEEAIATGSELLYENMFKVYPNLDKIVSVVGKDIDSAVVTTNGVIDEKKLNAQLPRYENVLKENLITPKIGELGLCSVVFVCAAAVIFVVAVHHHVAATINVAAAINVALAIAIKVKIGTLTDYTKFPKGTNDALPFEILIDDIANIKVVR